MKYYNTDATGKQQGPIEKNQPTQPKGISGKGIIVIACAAIVIAAIVGAVLFMRGGNNEAGTAGIDSTYVAIDNTAVSPVEEHFEVKMEVAVMDNSASFITKHAEPDPYDETKKVFYYANKNYYIEYPENANFDIEPLKKAICKVMFGKNNIPLDQAARKWLSEVPKHHDMLSNEFCANNTNSCEGENPECNWEFSKRCSWENYFEAPTGIVCFFCGGYDFMGGTHAIPYQSGIINYDCKEGHVVAYNDVFKPGSEEKLLPMLLRARQAMKDLDYTPEYAPKRVPTETMWLEADSVTFNYSVYEIGPYCEGYIPLRLSRKEVEPFFTEYARRLYNRK